MKFAGWANEAFETPFVEFESLMQNEGRTASDSDRVEAQP
jgi:hypothetical protein